MQFIWPLDDYILTRDFYYLASLYIGGQHAAIDLIRELEATRASPIRVVADGVVVGVGWDYYSGFFVAVDHAGGFRSFYRHLYGQTPVVVGQQVSQGQIIGNVGSTGGVSLGDHLHFDLWNRNKIRDDNAIFYKNDWYAVDPMKYLGREDGIVATLQELESWIKAWAEAHDRVLHAEGLDVAIKQLADIGAQLRQQIEQHQKVHDGHIAPRLESHGNRIKRNANDLTTVRARIKKLEERPAGGGVSEARVNELIEKAGHKTS